MAGVFARTNEVNNHPKRNTFPLSFQNNLSGKFGILYPCLVQDVIPGFTFKAKPTFALEFMPTAFPVQTRMRARMEGKSERQKSVITILNFKNEIRITFAKLTTETRQQAS